MLGKRTSFLDYTELGFWILHGRVHIHIGEQFRTSADLEGTMQQIPSIQHCWNTLVQKQWNHGLSRDLTRCSHWIARVPWRNSHWCESNWMRSLIYMPVLLVTISFWWMIMHDFIPWWLLRTILKVAIWCGVIWMASSFFRAESDSTSLVDKLLL